MIKVRAFNGFVPDAFPAKHQSMQQMEAWRSQLREATDVLELQTSIEHCWAYDAAEKFGPLYSADHPHEPADRYATPRDAVISQCVLHQRFFWVTQAVLIDPSVDIWAWIEPTIFKQRGVTAAVIQQFIEDIEDHPVDAISLPGVWDKRPVVAPVNHWRFCGSAWVCPRKYAESAFRVAMVLTAMRADLTKRICWDNSTWSYIELLNVLPMRWYPGNHDETQLTGYTIGADQWPKLTT